MIYIFDIDGTLANNSHRLHFIKQNPPDWAAFFKACSSDSPIEEVIFVACALAEAGATIVLISGRSDEVRAETEEWLKTFTVPYSRLLMRKQGDHREDAVVKAELLNEVPNDLGSEPIHGVFEDREQVVDMYRAKGLRVFQVADGKF